MIFGILNKEWCNSKKMSCRGKNARDIGICLKPHFYEKSQQLRNPPTDVSPTSGNKPQRSLVLYLQV